MTHLAVLAAGPSTTVQDAGRPGFAHLGVSPAGFADPLLAALANALVGNPHDAAVLEWTLHGDTLQVVGGPVRVAIAGWCDATVDASPAPTFRALRLHDGQILRVNALTRGRHAVLAVAGGVQTPRVLGSRSVHVRTGVGGQVLRVHDHIALLPDREPDAPDLMVPAALVPPCSSRVRVLAAPQARLFAPDAMAILVAQSWRVVSGDRMGLRLSGPALPLLPGTEPISEGAVTGALQVPPSGQPIALGPDRQTMGGYAKLAVAITADLRHLAQSREGAHVQFELVDDDAARQALRASDAALQNVLAALTPARDVLPFESRRLLRVLS